MRRNNIDVIKLVAFFTEKKKKKNCFCCLYMQCYKSFIYKQDVNHFFLRIYANYEAFQPLFSEDLIE